MEDGWFATKKFGLGDTVSVPRYDIPKATVIGVEYFTDSEVTRIGMVGGWQYKVYYTEDGQEFFDWYLEEYLVEL